MRYFMIVLFAMFLGCGGGTSYESETCTHCYLYAGQTLTYGNIDYGFAMADQLVGEYPPSGPVASALIRNHVPTLITIEDPQPEDFDICQDHTCSVVYEVSDITTHAMVYDYESDMFFDNCHCRKGCYYSGADRYIVLYATHSTFQPENTSPCCKQ